jgi:transcriptional regulator with XRE-family HTH domain
MDAAATLRSARRRAGLSQRTLAARAGTSQATISAYETGTKQPTLATFARLLAASGARLSADPSPPATWEPSTTELDRRGRTLVDVLALAHELPVRHEPELRFPRLDHAS